MCECFAWMYVCVHCLYVYVCAVPTEAEEGGQCELQFVCRPVGAQNQPWFLCNNHDLNCCSLSSPDLCLSFFFLSFALFSFFPFCLSFC